MCPSPDEGLLFTEPTGRALNDQMGSDLNNKINKIVLDYNPKDTINIHEYVLIQINESIN
jgi:hypothetical protein